MSYLRRRRVFGLSASFALLLTLAVAVLPADAAGPTKIYSLTGLPASLGPGGPGVTAHLTAVFKNETPVGNSQISSLTLTAAGGSGAFITEVTHVDSGVFTLSGDSKTITVQNMTPVKNGQTFKVDFTVSVPAISDPCGSLVTWQSTTWTGSNLSGQTFALTPPVVPTTAILPVSTVTGTCTVTFPNGSTASSVNAILIVGADTTACPGGGQTVAGSVTIIPTSSTEVIQVMFEDFFGPSDFPIGGYVPFCKKVDPDPVFHDVPLCSTILNGLNQENAVPNDPAWQACVTESLEFTDVNSATLHSIMYLDLIDPIGKH